MRGSVDEAVTKVRGEKQDSTIAEEADADASSKLDSLMDRLRGDANLADRQADKDTVDPDIIDGEVIDEKNNDGK